MKYTLDISGNKTLSNPTSADIEQAVRGLNTKNGDAFLILGTDDRTYLQCGGDATVGFDLEYQDGSLKNHFQAEGDLKQQDIIDIFVKYLNSDPGWKNGVAWKPLKL